MAIPIKQRVHTHRTLCTTHRTTHSLFSSANSVVYITFKCPALGGHWPLATLRSGRGREEPHGVTMTAHGACAVPQSGLLFIPASCTQCNASQHDEVPCCLRGTGLWRMCEQTWKNGPHDAGTVPATAAATTRRRSLLVFCWLLWVIYCLNVRNLDMDNLQLASPSSSSSMATR